MGLVLVSSRQLWLIFVACKLLSLGWYPLLGNRMFSFEDDDDNRYLPQLINMYIHMRDVAEAIHPYIVHR